ALLSSSENSGRGGTINLVSDTLALHSQGAISVAGSGSGGAGDVMLHSDVLTLDSQASIQAGTSGLGAGGGINVTEVDQLRISDAATISTETTSTGAGGTINVQAGSIDIETRGGLQSNSTAKGNGGTLQLSSESLNIQSGGVLSVAGTGSGTAGDIVLDNDSIHFDNANITALSAQSGGGNVKIQTRGFSQFNDSEITARAEGELPEHAGGNISIRGPDTLILENTPLNASAVGGPGGNVTIQAGTFVRSGASVLNVTSERNVPGTQVVEARQLLSEPQTPPTRFINTRNLLAQRCGSQNLEDVSHLLLTPYAGGTAALDDWQGSHWQAKQQDVRSAALKATATSCQPLQALRSVRQYLKDTEHDPSAIELQTVIFTETSPSGIALRHSQLADVLLTLQRPALASKHLEAALDIVEKLADPWLTAHVENNWGILLSIEGNHSTAIEAWQNAIQAATKAPLLKTQALFNLARSYTQQGQLAKAQATWREAWTASTAIPAEQTRIYQQLSLGQLALSLREQDSTLLPAVNLTEQFVDLLPIAANDEILKSYAHGYLAEALIQQGNYEPAAAHLRQAIFMTQQLPEMRYYWTMQQGRLWQAQGDANRAGDAYQQALNDLRLVQDFLMTGRRDIEHLFRAYIRPVYARLAALYLQQASANPTVEVELLQQARAVIELSKAAELQNYFQDDCVAAARARVPTRPNLPARTAVLYPLILSDRLELLLALPDEKLQHFTVDIAGEQLRQVVNNFGNSLQSRATSRFFTHSRQLHDWLIAPLREQLTTHNIDTLVLVPDGPLRTIPFAALHSGKKYLIQDFALSVTPALDLTELNALDRQALKILLKGISKGVQEFTPLPNVPNELKTIQATYSDSTLLLDEAFSLDAMQAEMRTQQYPVVHIASHGQFKPDPTETFVLTYEDKLTMNRMESFIGQGRLQGNPVELLTLSACQTAVGDERAALGLAGVAIKAGAHSALASLWFVDDEATSKLVSTFYQNLRNPENSRAQALQQSQQALLSERRFRHPAYWAPFLLIGSWL
ncbi:MAG: CHAT domain-containing protein, partial [Pseudomonadota bacterium]